MADQTPAKKTPAKRTPRPKAFTPKASNVLRQMATSTAQSTISDQAKPKPDATQPATILPAPVPKQSTPAQPSAAAEPTSPVPTVTVEDTPTTAPSDTPDQELPAVQPAPAPATAPLGPPVSGTALSLEDVAQRAAQAAQDAPSPRQPTVQIALYPPEGKADAFRQTAIRMGMTHGALVMHAVRSQVPQLERIFGPDPSHYVPGYTPRPRTRRDRTGISLRVTQSDRETLRTLAEAWPGCRSTNDLLSTAVDLLLADS